MNASEDYKLLDHAGKVIAMGTQGQMFSMLKHHVPDGRYRIVGPHMKVHCLRKDGVVTTDPDGVCLKRKGTNIYDLLDFAISELPCNDEEVEDDDE